MLKLNDEQLIAVLKTLNDSERQVIEACVKRGLRSEEAAEAIRKFRARLKARTRAGRHRSRAEKRKAGRPTRKERRSTNEA